MSVCDFVFVLLSCKLSLRYSHILGPHAVILPLLFIIMSTELSTQCEV